MSLSKKEKRKILTQSKKSKPLKQKSEAKVGFKKIEYLPDKGKVELTFEMGMIPPSQDEYLKSIDPHSIDNASEKLNKLDYSKVSDTEIQSILSSALAYEKDFVSISPMSINPIIIPPGEILYRVRDNRTNFNCESQFWYNPIGSEYYNRLNKPHDPIFYISDSPLTSMLESKIPKNEEFYLLAYLTLEEIKLVKISPSYINSGQYPEIEKKVSTFLVNEFSRDVPNDRNEIYRITNCIGNFFFPYKIHNFDGWNYPSAVRKNKTSIAICPDSTDQKLSFLYLAECLYTETEDFLIKNPQSLNIDGTLFSINHMNKFNSFEQFRIQKIQKYYNSLLK
ncbi:RES domain-containing protein [Enterococcus viikkiensis]|uniref:RES domain-containing protein n=1 Tax=Enterococcus viikkiensis TaxID=930854 RepID=UPI0010F46C9D|nr:RES domain-containing protein [Enterococcus viikkiensis]